MLSDLAVVDVLEQFAGSSWRSLAFISWKLRKPEIKHSLFDKKLLAMHLAIRHFKYFLNGRPFTINTDIKLLTFAFFKISDPWSARQQRQIVAISEFTMDIRDIAGKVNAWRTSCLDLKSSRLYQLQWFGLHWNSICLSLPRGTSLLYCYKKPATWRYCCWRFKNYLAMRYFNLYF